jgi:hypothetical protein
MSFIVARLYVTFDTTNIFKDHQCGDKFPSWCYEQLDEVIDPKSTRTKVTTPLPVSQKLIV